MLSHTSYYNIKKVSMLPAVDYNWKMCKAQIQEGGRKKHLRGAVRTLVPVATWKTQNNVYPD